MENEPNHPAATNWSRLRYYVRSLFTLLRGVRSWGALMQIVRGRPAVIILRGGLSFKVRSLMDVWIIKETCLDRDYESFGVNVENGWTVVDIGAGLGDFAVLVGRRHPLATVIAFEPFDESFALLQENIALNRVSNITAVPAAVAAENGVLTLSQTGAAVQHTTQGGAAGAASEQVSAVGLTDLMTRYQIEKIDFLKIDCEGGEFDILLNTPAETLHHVNYIALEFHDSATRHHHSELVNRFQQLGFTVATRPNPVHRDLGLMFGRRVVEEL